VLSLLSFHFVEAPALRLVDRVTRGLRSLGKATAARAIQVSERRFFAKEGLKASSEGAPRSPLTRNRSADAPAPRPGR